MYTKALYDERMVTLAPLKTRMNEDLELWLLNKYTFVKADGSAVKDAESITTNDPRVFADFVISVLSSTERNIEVTGSKIDENNNLEKFINYCITRADENLAAAGDADVGYSCNWNACLRGAITMVALLKTDGKKWYVDIQPVDAYATTWDIALGRCDYAGLHMNLSRGMILRNYGIEIKGKESLADDIWTDTQHELYLDGKQQFSDNHTLGVNPFIVVPVVTSPHFVYSNVLKYLHESIYAGARDLYPVLNRHMSAMATANIRSTFRPAVFKTDRYDELEQPPAQADAVSTIGTNEALDLFPIADFSAAYQALISQLHQQIQRATVSNISMGELQLHGISALALTQLDKAKDRIFVPRVKAKNRAITTLGYNLKTQLINGGYKVKELPEGVGEELNFDVNEFRDRKFMIKVEHYTEKPEATIANMTLAANARAIGMPEKYVMEKILKVDDYRDIEFQGMKEKAIARTPMLENLYEARALLEVGDEYDEAAATILLREIGMEIRGSKIVPIKQSGNKQGNGNQQPKPSYDLTETQAIEQSVRSDEAALVSEEADREGQRISSNQRRM